MTQPALTGNSPAPDQEDEVLYQGVWYSREDFERHRRLGLVEGPPGLLSDLPDLDEEAEAFS
jgi:hypothetical protein